MLKINRFNVTTSLNSNFEESIIVDNSKFPAENGANLVHPLELQQSITVWVVGNTGLQIAIYLLEVLMIGLTSAVIFFGGFTLAMMIRIWRLKRKLKEDILRYFIEKGIRVKFWYHTWLYLYLSRWGDFFLRFLSRVLMLGECKSLQRKEDAKYSFLAVKSCLRLWAVIFSWNVDV